MYAIKGEHVCMILYFVDTGHTIVTCDISAAAGRPESARKATTLAVASRSRAAAQKTACRACRSVPSPGAPAATAAAERPGSALDRLKRLSGGAG